MTYPPVAMVREIGSGEVVGAPPGTYRIAADARSIEFVEPTGDYVRLPLAPTPHGWGFNGNIDRPTLWPSIRTSRGDQETWHGYISNGEMISC